MTSESSLPAAGGPSAKAPAALHPSMVLGAYLEPLVRGRRVAILGDATIGLAERLLERGARLVHAYDADPVRVAEMLARAGAGRQPHPSFAVLDNDLGVRDGAFDTLVVPDLASFADPAEILRRARRLIAPNGAAVVAAPNPDAPRSLVDSGADRAKAPGYYALYDLVSLQFRHVRMCGQAPFVGYTVADFAPDGEPEVSVDTSLLEVSESPEWFIAVAGDRPVRLDAFSVIEIPFADLPAGGGAASAEALSDAEARAAAFRDELAELRTRHQRDREDAGARAETATATAARLAEVEAELSAKAGRLREVEARAGDTHVRAERLTHQIRDMDEELRTQRDRATRLAKQLDDEKKARTKVELEIGMIRNKPEIAGAKDRLDAAAAELDAARARIAELEAVVRQAEAAPEVAAPSAALTQRIEELETAFAGAKRELARLTSERDAARKRAQDAERGREETERTLEEAQRARREQAAKHAELAAANHELGREREALAERAGRLEKERRAAEEQRAALDARRQLLEARIVELEQRVLDLEQRDPGDAAAAAEIAALEEALRERGHVIAALKAELRESERVGKELVDELGVLFDAPGAGERGGSGGAGGSGGGERGPGAAAPDAGAADQANGLRQQLDALARSAAAGEADLRAANWRIAQLERELSEARDASASPTTLQVELEQALVAARAELAALRRSAQCAEDVVVAPEVIEQAVLLQQVAAAAEAGL